MNAFMDQLDADLNAVFFNLAEFGELITYFPQGETIGTEIRALFDRPWSSAATGSTVDVVENRPHLTIREKDVDGGEVNSGDRFMVRGKLYRPIDDQGNGMGVIRLFLHEVER